MVKCQSSFSVDSSTQKKISYYYSGCTSEKQRIQVPLLKIANNNCERIYNIKLDKKCQTCIMYNNGVLNPGLVHHIIVTDNINKSVVFSFFQENSSYFQRQNFINNYLNFANNKLELKSNISNKSFVYFLNGVVVSQDYLIRKYWKSNPLEKSFGTSLDDPNLKFSKIYIFINE